MKEMFRFLFSLRGNARACLYTEPLWGIPFNLYAPFITMYMYHLGVLDVQIGLILGLGRLLQVPVCLIGGVVTDKFGRRYTTLVGDILAWSVPALIWTFSQNFWWFLAAAIVNASMQLSTVSWECLWVDDTDESKIGPIYNWIYICGLLAVFFAPLSGYFVGVYGVVPVVRVLYFLAFISMTAKFIILFVFSNETERGVERMAATAGVPIGVMLAGYKAVAVQLFKSREMVRALVLQSAAGVTILVTGTFFALYATQDLLLPEAFLAYFPILRAAVMLAFLLAIQEKLSKFKSFNVMLAGIGLFVAAVIWLIVAPAQNWLYLAVYIIAEACASAMILPRIDALAANSIDATERARIRSLFNMSIIGASAPLVFFAGILSEMDRRLPFVLNLVLFMVMILIVVDGRRRKVPI